MPRIPLPTVSLQTGSTPGYSAPGTSPQGDVAGRQIGQLGAAMESAGTAIAAVATTLQDQVDEARTKESYTQWADASSGVLRNSHDGYLNKVGKSAVGQSREAALNQIEAKRKEYEEGLDNETQRGIFREAAARHMIGVKETVYSHEAGAMAEWNYGQAQALEQQSIDDAADAFMRKPPAGKEEEHAVVVAGAQLRADASNPQNQEPGQIPAPAGKGPSYETFRNTAIDQTNAKADIKGLGPDDPQRAAMVKATTTQLHATIVERLIDGDRLKEAKDYASKIPGKEIDSTVMGKINKAIEGETRADDALRLSMEILDGLTTKVDNPETGPATGLEAMGQELAYASSRPAAQGTLNTTTMVVRAEAELKYRFREGKIDSKTYSMALANVREQHSILVAEWNGNAQKVLLEGEKFLANNPSVTSIDSPSFPRALRDRLIEFGQLDNADRIASARAKTGGRVTDSATYYQMLHDNQRGALVGMTETELFNRYYAGLSSTDWNEAQHKLEVANQKPVVKRPKDDALYSVDKQLQKLAFDMHYITKISYSGGGPPSYLPDSDAEAGLLSEFYRELQERVNKAQADPARKGAELSTEEIMKEAAAMATSWGRVPSGYLSSDQHLPSWALKTEEDRQKFMVTDKASGTEVNLASIPAPARNLMNDSHRLMSIPASQRAMANELYMNLDPGEGSANRAAIDQLFEAYGVRAVEAPEGFVATTWNVMRNTPNTYWFKHSDRAQSEDRPADWVPVEIGPEPETEKMREARESKAEEARRQKQNRSEWKGKR